MLAPGARRRSAWAASSEQKRPSLVTTSGFAHCITVNALPANAHHVLQAVVNSSQ